MGQRRYDKFSRVNVVTESGNVEVYVLPENEESDTIVESSDSVSVLPYSSSINVSSVSDDVSITLARQHRHPVIVSVYTESGDVTVCGGNTINIRTTSGNVALHKRNLREIAVHTDSGEVSIDTPQHVNDNVGLIRSYVETNSGNLIVRYNIDMCFRFKTNTGHTIFSDVPPDFDYEELAKR